MKIEKVLVVGCGTMGGQIAMQTALCGYQVCAYDLKPEVVQRAKAYSAAGSDARMSGCEMPVVILSGSGNQGITACMPVVAYARHIGATW